MRRPQRYEGILEWFRTNRPSVQSELVFSDPFQLLVAVILSAQCTDRRVNMVTPELFRRFPDAAAMAAASFDDVFELIRSVSYPRSKATHLIGTASRIVSEFGGSVPSTVDELMTLPGVGRKTANVVTSIVYDNPVIAVDTHVFRVSRRLGLSDGKTVEAVERDLERHIPAEYRSTAHHWLILHGRYVCVARRPRCEACGLAGWCREFAAKGVSLPGKA